jgi:Holliday junction resolvase-like predicted endonuclease
MITKEADSIGYVEVKTDKNEAIKADSVNTNDINKIQAKLVINTTNIMDSHSDVHLKGICS